MDLPTTDETVEHIKFLRDFYTKLGKKLTTKKYSLDQFVEELVENHIQLEKMADYDGLIDDFLNSNGFKKALDRELSILRRRGDVSSTLLALDIDHLKKFNDSLGHPAGDKLIKTYTSVMREQVRVADLKGRVGGDEFLVFLIGASIEDGEKVAEKIRHCIIEEVKKAFPKLSWEQTISIGITQTTNDDNADSLRKRADQALYEAKEKRNQIVTN